MKADHSIWSMAQRGTAWSIASALRSKLAVGDIRPDEVNWLYNTTGYEKYTVSALRMCDEIIETYKIEGLTARLMR